MFLGLGLDHDAGVAIVESDGRVIWAASEERFSRKKNHCGFPFQAVDRAIKDCGLDHDQIIRFERIVFGTYGRLNVGRTKNIIDYIEKQPFDYSPLPFGKNTDYVGYWETPGERWVRDIGEADEQEIKDKLSKYLKTFLYKRFSIQGEISFSIHHDSHRATAYFGSGFKKAMVITMDGQGDGESATISIGDTLSKPIFTDLFRCPARDSLGHLYSAITNLYGLKTNRHEGKVLGLVAKGGPSPAISALQKIVSVTNGVPHVEIPDRHLFQSLKSDFFREFRHTDHLEFYTQTLKVANPPDLAYAVQKVIEETVLKVVSFWVTEFDLDCVALAGGLFANVKLNQVLAESLYPLKVYVYPHMGDGGLPVGGVWDWMQSMGLSITNSPHESMLCGPEITSDISKTPETSFYGIDKCVIFNKTKQDYADVIAQLIAQKIYCAIVDGKLEFGPRALGSRSILADPRSITVNSDLNERLKRSEYMPFAPICLEEDFEDVFEVAQHGLLNPFRYMTMLCQVRPNWAVKIPAVVHVDGTARPQIISKNDYPFLHQILSSFKRLTGIPVLVNTSFNLHEEPIVASLSDSLRALRSGGVDVLCCNNTFYYLSGDYRIKDSLENLGCNKTI